MEEIDIKVIFLIHSMCIKVSLVVTEAHNLDLESSQHNGTSAVKPVNIHGPWQFL